MPKSKKLEWELKDGARILWSISAVKRCEEPSETEGGYFETVWDVKVKTEPGSPKYIIETSVATQYDEPVKLNEIARAVHDEIMQFYDAALTA